jgi:type II secretory pathway component HofQ
MATVEVGTTYPVQVTQITEIASITSFQDEEIHITLNVQPRLSSDGYITMVIEAVVQALVGFSGVNNDQPIISERKTRAQNMVKSGETLLIGGLIFEQLIETETKVPIASSIPLLGKLFKHRITETEQRELLIFITPTKVIL